MIRALYADVMDLWRKRVRQSGVVGGDMKVIVKDIEGRRRGSACGGQSHADAGSGGSGGRKEEGRGGGGYSACWYSSLEVKPSIRRCKRVLLFAHTSFRS